MDKEILEKNGFNSNGITYMICGNTFPYIEELKIKGAKFNSKLKWHAPEKLKDKRFYYVPLDINKIYSYNKKENKLDFKEESIQYINEEINKYYPDNFPDYYVGSLKTRLRNIEVILDEKRSFLSTYGLTNVYTFKNKFNMKFIWYTQKEYDDILVGDDLLLTGTFVDKLFINGEKVNKINRCILKKIG